MTAIDKAILDTNSVICKNISKFDVSERGLLSQNILSQLRNLIEYIAMKICSQKPDVDPNNYDKRVECLKKLKTNGKLKFLYKFHELLQISVSHYTLDANTSERLMLKYYEYLLKIKIFLSESYSLSILENIEEFPLNTDNNIAEYYEKISEKINAYSLTAEEFNYKDRLYIRKIKPFFVKGKIYYEITFTIATDNVSKFDRVIAFTSLDILENYAVKFSMHKDVIEIMNNKMEILIIDSWEVSIRPCELNHFGFIFTGKSEIKSTNTVYRNLMSFIYEYNLTLLELIESSEEFYTFIKMSIISQAKNTALFDIFDKCRCIIKEKLPGSNILRYLLYTMNNSIIKSQLNYNGTCNMLSNLHLSHKCIPFDQMPFITSLIQHNPRIFNLIDCIPTQNRNHEFLARQIKTNTENNGILFTKIKDLDYFKPLNELINLYNEKLYCRHQEQRSLQKKSNIIYINEYAKDCSYIVNRLKSLAISGIKGYDVFIKSWLQDNSEKIDDEIKRQALLQMFSDSHVAFVYGSAGTGKSTLIRLVSEIFASKNKLYIANTNPAVDNLQRKITVDNSTYMTITKFLSNKNSKIKYDIVFMDECSTISNSDMRKLLEKMEFNLLILVGDIYQIEAIQFGNWYSIAKHFIPKNAVFELKNTYRSTDKNLQNIWSKVRNIEDSMQEAIDKFGYSKQLDNSVFEKEDADEIILCLNYDGLYGINNINSFLQNNNPNKTVMHGVHAYKIGDPILFNESNRFSPIIYNNMKGTIININETEKTILFDIEIDTVLNELDTYGYDFILLDNSENKKSIIQFSVDKNINTDSDKISSIMPFQIAYAISIHKAQGLEYNSVKIIISSEVEERISHNIFYTAITRAKKKLKIYWSPETEKNILSGFKKNTQCYNDYLILKELYNL